MGKPYRSGTTPDGKPLWSARSRVMGQDIFVSGQESAKNAREEIDRQVRELKAQGRHMHGGPQAHTVAQALQRYALERLPFMKSAGELARDINRYLRAGCLQTLDVSRLPASEQDLQTLQREAALGVCPTVVVGDLFVVRLQSADTPRVIPNGLHETRKKLITKTATSSRHRDVLANTRMSDVTRHQVQALFDAMRAEGSAAATVLKERSLLSPLFNYAKKHWRWTTPASNPVTELKLPKLDNGRTRVMSATEEELLTQAMTETRNALMEPTMRLLAQSAMRVGEAIYEATWADVDWKRHMLVLKDSKTGGREVPLSPQALQALEDIRALGSSEPHERIVSITYESLKAAWRRACQRAGVKNLRLHDLRHTAATRMALKTGNVFLVKALTGHKTLTMVERYVNVSAADAVAVLHDQQPASPYAGLAGGVMPNKPAKALPAAQPVAAPVAAPATASAPVPATAPVAPSPALPEGAMATLAGGSLPEGVTADWMQSLMAVAVQAAMAQVQSVGTEARTLTGSLSGHGAGQQVLTQAEQSSVQGDGAGTTAAPALAGNVIAFKRKRA